MLHHQDSDYISLELPEVIRLNQLVRGRIDLAGFVAWYDALTASEQVALLHTLHEFAEQAPFMEAEVVHALNAVQLPTDDPLIKQLLTFQGGMSKTQEPVFKMELEYKWLTQKVDSERRILLRFLAFLFGYAEGRVYSGCHGAWCNHWWHRDLLDERVVQNLLSNPLYYRTSPKDDQPVEDS